MLDTKQYWNKVHECRASVVRSLATFELNGIDVDAMYMDVALKLLDGETPEIDLEKLRGLLRYKTRYACMQRLQCFDDDPARRAPLYAPNGTDEPLEPSEAVQQAEYDAANAAWQRSEIRLDVAMRLNRIPEELALFYRAIHELGYGQEELAAKLNITRAAVRARLHLANEALKQVERDEAEGKLLPRVARETPRQKAAREEIERRCAAFRPAQTKPTMRIRKLDPRAFWYAGMTLDYFDWIKEMAEVRWGKQFPHANPWPWFNKLPAAMTEMPVISLVHKLEELALYTDRQKEEHATNIPLKKAA